MALTHVLVQTRRHFVSDAMTVFSVKEARKMSYPLVAECGVVWIPGEADETESLPMCVKCDVVNHRRTAPREEQPHFVYRLYDADDALLYVGMTYDPRNRRQGHKRKEWWPEVARFRLTVYSDKATALRAESQAIRAEHPVHNIRGRDLRILDGGVA